MAEGSMAVPSGCHPQKANISASGGMANYWYVTTTRCPKKKYTDLVDPSD